MIEHLIPNTVDRDVYLAYKPVLSNWSKLSAFLVQQKPTVEVIGALLRIELSGSKRRDIVLRLTQRLGTAVRERIHLEVSELCEREILKQL